MRDFQHYGQFSIEQWEKLSNCIHLKVLADLERAALDQLVCNLDVEIPNRLLRTINPHRLLMQPLMHLSILFSVTAQHILCPREFLDRWSPRHLEMFTIVQDANSGVICPDEIHRFGRRFRFIE